MDLFEGGIILWPINWCILYKFYCKGLLISGEVLFFFRGGGAVGEGVVFGGILLVCNKTQL